MVAGTVVIREGATYPIHILHDAESTAFHEPAEEEDHREAA
jgi:hypothetical protein